MRHSRQVRLEAAGWSCQMRRITSHSLDDQWRRNRLRWVPECCNESLSWLRETSQLEGSHGESELGLNPCPRLVIILAINLSADSPCMSVWQYGPIQAPLHRKVQSWRCKPADQLWDAQGIPAPVSHLEPDLANGRLLSPAIHRSEAAGEVKCWSG